MNLPALPKGNGGGNKHHDASNGIHAHPFGVANESRVGEPTNDRNNTKLLRAQLNAKSSHAPNHVQPRSAALS
jgi:hypothetical protein